MNKKELAALEYVCGYIAHKTFCKLRLKKKPNDYTVQAMELLRSLRENDAEAIERQRLIKIKNRGGLWTTKRRFIDIFLDVEKTFLTKTSRFLTKIDAKALVHQLMESQFIWSMFKNLMDECEITLDKQLMSHLLETLLSLYVRMRCFSYAKSVKEKYVSEHKKKKSRSTRTEIKKSVKGPEKSELE